MGHTITVFPSEKSKKGGRVITYETFKDLAAQFKQCDQERDSKRYDYTYC